MAAVPYQVLPSVGIRPANINYENVGADPTAFGAGVVRAAGGLANELQNTSDQAFFVAQRLQAQTQAAAAQDADNQFSDGLRQLLFDPQNGYYNLKGKAAFDGVQGIGTQIQQLRDRVAGSISDPLARQRFSEVAASRSTSALTDIDRYASNQRDVWFDQSDAASINNFVSDGGTYWNNPAKLDLSSAGIQHYTQQMAERNNWSPEQTMAAQRANMTKLHVAVLNGMAASDPAQAYAYWQNHAGEMDGVNAAFVEALHTKAIEHRAQGNVATLMGNLAAAPDNTTASGTQPTQGNAVQAIVSAANAAGIDPSIALTIANRESSFQADAKNPNSTAYGLGQFTDGTWAAIGGTAQNRNDVTAQANAIVQYAQQNSSGLKAGLGRDPAGWEIAFAHQQGLAGSLKALRADPTANAASVLGLDAVQNNMTKDQQATTAPDKITIGDFVKLQQAAYNTVYVPADAAPALAKGNRAAQYQQILNITDPLERDETLKQWIAQVNTADAVTAQSQKAARDKALDQVLNGTDPRTLPLADRTAMGPDNFQTLRDYYDTRAKEADKTISNTNIALLTDAKVRDPAGFVQTDLRPLLLNHQLTPDDFKTAVNDQQQTATMLQTRTKDATTDSLKLADEVSKPLLMAAGIMEPTSPTGWDKVSNAIDSSASYDQNAKTYGDFKAKLYDTVRGAVVAKGSALTGKEVEGIVNNMLLPATFKNAAGGTRDKAPLFTMAPDELPTAVDVPTTDKTRLVSALSRGGFTVQDNDGLNSIYAALLSGDKGALQMALNAHTDQAATEFTAGQVFQAYVKGLPVIPNLSTPQLRGLAPLNPAAGVNYPEDSIQDLQQFVPLPDGTILGEINRIGAIAGRAFVPPTPNSPKKTADELRNRSKLIMSPINPNPPAEGQ